MKQKIEFLLLFVALAFAGCGSDRNNKSHNDSLMTDTAVMDTTNMNAAPIDTTAMKIDTIGPDTGLARQRP